MSASSITSAENSPPTRTSFRPSSAEIAARGLVYLDDGSSPRSLARETASTLDLPSANADVVIDADPAPEAIEAALTRLEALARSRGGAIGVAAARAGQRRAHRALERGPGGERRRARARLGDDVARPRPRRAGEPLDAGDGEKRSAARTKSICRVDKVNPAAIPGGIGESPRRQRRRDARDQRFALSPQRRRHAHQPRRRGLHRPAQEEPGGGARRRPRMANAAGRHRRRRSALRRGASRTLSRRPTSPRRP